METTSGFFTIPATNPNWEWKPPAGFSQFLQPTQIGNGNPSEFHNSCNQPKLGMETQVNFTIPEINEETD
jgi:hypothetical protein